ncbi:MAG TPA: glycosyltransferase family 2 protein [Anaerolineales bacterium]|nr:glycosyltransferase family 2 protein [Anaerolineales bacterium]
MKLSIIIPVLNEEQNLLRLYESIRRAVDPLGLAWEIVFVDDASTDGSVLRLKEIARKDRRHARIVLLRRNYGQTAAIAAGIDHAEGDTIILMDADLQNDPADIPVLIAKLDEGYDVVSGWRKNRKDVFLTRTLPSALANTLISWVTGVHLHDYGCTLKIYRREILNGFRLYGEMHRFIPAYAYSVGARLTEVVVQHHPRRYGKSKIKFGRTLRVILDLLTVKFLMSFSVSPIYIFGGTGIATIFLSMATLLLLAIRRLFWGISVLGSPFFQIGVMFFVLGFQSILMGLIAELLIRTYHETLGKPTYTVREEINIKSRSK